LLAKKITISATVLKRVLGLSLVLSLQAVALVTVDPGQPANFLTGYGKAEAVTTLDVRNYGAKGNGVTNDTAAIQNAINALPTTGGIVVIPSGTYMVDAVKSLNLKNNTTIQMTPTTILKVIPNSADWSAALTIKNVASTKIYSGVLVGDRYTHLGTSGEHGMGVGIFGGNGVIVQGTTANNMWGDGFYIGTGSNATVSRNVQLIDVKADNNRRQGISLISGNGVSIIRPRLTNTNGKAPSAGLDIEPSKITDTLQNISIVDPYTAGNAAAGISINLAKLTGSTVPVSIRITNHVDDGSQRGFSAAGLSMVPGSLVIDNPIWKNNKLNGFLVTNHDYRTYSITVNNPQVINANTEGSTTNLATGSAFSIYNYTSGVLLGGVTINNAKITDLRSTPRTVHGFYVVDTLGKAINKVSLVAPVINGKILRTMLKTSDIVNVKIK